jgi:hypothetical protein
VDHVDLGRNRIGDLWTDLARCQASGGSGLAVRATRGAPGGAFLLILLALALVRRSFLIGRH